MEKDKIHIMEQNGRTNIFYVDDKEEVKKLLFLGYIHKKDIYLSSRCFDLFSNDEIRELIDFVT